MNNFRQHNKGWLMNFQEKLKIALDKLSTTGIRRGSYAPPLYRGLWNVGVKVPPPHFSSFIFNALFIGSWAVFLIALSQWFPEWSRQGASLSSVIANSAAIGGSFGIIIALYYQYSARRHKLPLWENLVQNPNEDRK